MKNTYRSYLYITLIILLGAISSSYAKTDYSTGTSKTFSNQYLQSLDIHSFHYLALNQTSDFDYFIEVSESKESENEESAIKTKGNTSFVHATAFTNAILFQNFSKELEKNISRSPNTIIRPKAKLFIQFQVFII